MAPEAEQEIFEIGLHDQIMGKNYLKSRKKSFFHQLMRRKSGSDDKLCKSLNQETIEHLSETSQTSSIQSSIDFNPETIKPRRLRILVANDSDFQLLIVASILEKLPMVEKVDKASNG